MCSARNAQTIKRNKKLGEGEVEGGRNRKMEVDSSFPSLLWKRREVFGVAWRCGGKRETPLGGERIVRDDGAPSAVASRSCGVARRTTWSGWLAIRTAEDGTRWNDIFIIIIKQAREYCTPCVCCVVIVVVQRWEPLSPRNDANSSRRTKNSAPYYPLI